MHKRKRLIFVISSVFGGHKIHLSFIGLERLSLRCLPAIPEHGAKDSFLNRSRPTIPLAPARLFFPVIATKNTKVHKKEEVDFCDF
jgi:hypothetical protein